MERERWYLDLLLADEIEGYEEFTEDIRRACRMAYYLGQEMMLAEGDDC